MKITHVNTYDIDGGAARSAYRLHKGLLKIGENSQMLSKYKKSQDRQVYQILTDNEENKQDFADFNPIQTHYINNNRTSLTNTLFSFAYPGYDLAKLPIIENSDVINLHWVAAEYQSPVTIKNLLDLGKPVIWTLHDMWAFTGGCHYSAGCENYQTDCLKCPQLAEDIYNLPHLILQDKIANFNYPNLVIVTPSQWLANCVRNSQVFKNQRVEVIPYSLDTDIFVSTPKLLAKNSLNIPSEEIVLLVGAVSGKEKRKGFSELIEVLKICEANEKFANLIKANKIKVYCFGEPIDNFEELNIKVRTLGIVNSDEKLSEIYASADIFILSSLEDNLPNTMLEAMSCGTPVIGFDIGGIPDLVKNGITGFVTSEKDLTVMANKIIELVFNHELRQKMSENCRQLMVNNHALHIQADTYVNLYRELLKNNLSDNLSNNKERFIDNKNELITSINFDFLNNLNTVKYHIIAYSSVKKIDNLENIISRQENDIKELNKIIENKDFHLQNYIKNNNELLEQIEAMKSSKFWKLRNLWFSFKTKILSNVEK